MRNIEVTWAKEDSCDNSLETYIVQPRLLHSTCANISIKNGEPDAIQTHRCALYPAHS